MPKRMNLFCVRMVWVNYDLMMQTHRFEVFFLLYCANTYVYVKSCSLYKNVRPPHDHPRLEVFLAFCNVPGWISWRAFCRFGLRYQCSRYSMLVTMCCAGERRWGEIGGQRGFSLECSMKILRYINRPTPNNQHQGLRNTKCHPKKGWENYKSRSEKSFHKIARHRILVWKKCFFLSDKCGLKSIKGT